MSSHSFLQTSSEVFNYKGGPTYSKLEVHLSGGNSAMPRKRKTSEIQQLLSDERANRNLFATNRRVHQRTSNNSNGFRAVHYEDVVPACPLQPTQPLRQPTLQEPITPLRTPTLREMELFAENEHTPLTHALIPPNDLRTQLRLMVTSQPRTQTDGRDGYFHIQGRYYCYVSEGRIMREVQATLMESYGD